jgi:hypothetical protein
VTGGYIPVAPADDVAALERQDVAGQQFVDVLEHRFAARERARAEELRNGAFVRLRRHEAALEDGLDFGREDQAIAAARPVERFDPEAVAGHEQTAPACIPDGEREHAAEVVDAGVAPLLVGVHDALGIRLRAIQVPKPLELAPQIAVVVDLAVEGNPGRLVLVGERLLAGGQIHDAQTAVAKCRLLVDKDPFSVGTAMHDAVAHRHHALAISGRQLTGRNDSYDSTHADRSLTPG